jgi:DNA sulfur modification protein DndB
MDTIKELSDDDKTNLRTKYGSGAKQPWLRNFQNYVHTKQKDYLPLELVEWLERQDEELQDEGGKLVNNIESYIKSTIIENLRSLFKENWDLEIGSIKKDCQSRSDAEVEKHYKETGIRKESRWTQQFNIMDYKWIIEKHWTKVPESGTPENFTPFSDIFSIDLGDGFNSKSEKLKWISLFNSHRNNVAHSGTKEQGLSKADVKFLQKVHGSLKIKVD